VTLLMSGALAGCVGQPVDSSDDEETVTAAEDLQVAPPVAPAPKQQVIDPTGGDPREDPEPSPWDGAQSGGQGGPHDPGDPGDDNMNPEPSPWTGDSHGGSVIVRTTAHK